MLESVVSGLVQTGGPDSLPSPGLKGFGDDEEEAGLGGMAAGRIFGSDDDEDYEVPIPVKKFPKMSDDIGTEDDDTEEGVVEEVAEEVEGVEAESEEGEIFEEEFEVEEDLDEEEVEE
jgi:hypothetical protein